MCYSAPHFLPLTFGFIYLSCCFDDSYFYFICSRQDNFFWENRLLSVWLYHFRKKKDKAITNAKMWNAAERNICTSYWNCLLFNPSSIYGKYVFHINKQAFSNKAPYNNNKNKTHTTNFDFFFIRVIVLTFLGKRRIFPGWAHSVLLLLREHSIYSHEYFKETLYTLREWWPSYLHLICHTLRLNRFIPHSHINWLLNCQAIFKMN